MVALAADNNGPWDISKTSVVLLGSGFSAAATNGALPTMRGFFSSIDETRYSLLAKFVIDVEGNIENANVETVLLALEQISRAPCSIFCDELSLEWQAKSAEIRHSLEDYVLERLSPSAHLEPANWATQLLAHCGRETTVVSMNYDNIAERVLSNRKGLRHGSRPTCPHCKMCRMMEKACSCDGKFPLTRQDWLGSIVKPHGSVAWRRCRNRDCCQFECLVADQHCRPFSPCQCPSCCSNCGPVIVLPSMMKHLEEVPTIATMWEVCSRAIQEATTILIFGFSFPASDQLLHYVFKKGLEKNRSPLSCAIIDLDPHSVALRVSAAVPADRTVALHEFPVEVGRIPTWLEPIGV